ncbi:hypothetical protein ElyMa_002830400 [Elysia marginata]|uniref:Uncharacterized protein n=1 Tax=Elysia marginata TaxID=1093978 RepID=A0AAV4HX60_9GAST|nr:hypothetical protein ElyMa_002830400 [Elysia marginata]
MGKNYTDSSRRRNRKATMEMDWPHSKKAMWQHHKECVGLEPTGEKIKRKTQRNRSSRARYKLINEHKDKGVGGLCGDDDAGDNGGNDYDDNGGGNAIRGNGSGNGNVDKYDDDDDDDDDEEEEEEDDGDDCLCRCWC